MRGVLIGLWVGCAAPSQEQEPDPSPSAWVVTLATESSVFERLMTTSERSGWIAFHKHDYLGAYGAFQGKSSESHIGRARAAQALSSLYADWHQIQTQVVTSYVAGLDPARPTRDSSVAVDLLKQAQNCPETPTASHQATASRARQPLSIKREGALTLTDWYDTCPYHSLSVIWSERQVAASLGVSPDDTPTANLARTLFSGSDGLSQAQAIADLRRKMDEEFEQVRQQASTEGAALLEALGVKKRLEQQTLILASKRAFATANRARALALASAAYSPGHPVGPDNAPEVFTQLAWTQLTLGHEREAMFHLSPLLSAYPEAKGLIEWMGDLVVLKGLGRHGDSKEN